MSLWLEAAFAKYGWIWIGLTFGLAAKYALLLKRGIRIRPGLVCADILLLPLVALIAYNGAWRLGVTGETAALVTAIATVGADRLVKLYTERFLMRVDAELREIADRHRGEIISEVQNELSGKEIIHDQLRSAAPVEYETLKRPHRDIGKKPRP